MHLGEAVTSKPKKIENRGWSHYGALSNGHLVFIFKIFCYEAIANQSDKVRISQIQQQPPKSEVTDRLTDRRTDQQTDPLIEMRGRI